MPAVGRFLDILEAVSRKDWVAIEKIIRVVAKEERKKKHYQVAHRLERALEVVASTSQLSDTIGTFSSPIIEPHANPPELLHTVDLTTVCHPVIDIATESLILEFVGEWKREVELRSKGVEPRRSVLLYGPPGCGKTLLASYIAKTLSMPLYLVRFDGLISSYLGETASNLKSVFQFFSSNRCVLLLDELDAIGKLRDDKNELGELKRVVISLLQNLDISNNRSILISATNHPHILDHAIWRRFEFILEIKAPTEEARLAIVERNISNQIPADLQEKFILATEGFTGSDLVQICKDSKRKYLLSDGSDILQFIFLSIMDRLNQIPSEKTKRKADEKKVNVALV